MRKFLLLPLLGAALLFGGCNLPGENNIVYVDVQKVYSDSKAAQAAEEHMKQVRDALQKGMDEIGQTYANAAQDARENAVREGIIKLNTQMEREREAAHQVVFKTMQDAIDHYGEQNPSTTVVARQNLLRPAKDMKDITADIISEMDTKTPKFAELPKVSVKGPDDKSAAGAAQQAPRPTQGAQKK